MLPDFLFGIALFLGGLSLYFVSDSLKRSKRSLEDLSRAFKIQWETTNTLISSFELLFEIMSKSELFEDTKIPNPNIKKPTPPENIIFKEGDPID